MKCKNLILLIGGLISILNLPAQENDPSSTGAIGVKWSPASIFFGKISLFGEYSLSDNKSITLGIGVPFNKTTTQEIDGENESLTQKTFSIMGGYRMYLGNNPGKGLYFEPYLKYLKHEAHGILDRLVGGDMREFDFSSDYSGVGLGAQLGVQFVIAKSVLIDFYFLGPEGNISKHNTISKEIGNAPPWDAQDAADAEDEINDFFSDIPFLRDRIEVSVNAAQKTATTKYNGFLPGFRLGLSVGVRF